MIDSRILTFLLVFAASGGSAFADSFQVRGSLRQFFVIGASSGASVELFDPAGLQVQKGMTDELGGLVFRNVEPGKGYVAAVTVKGEKFFSEPTLVLSEKDVPPESFYQSQVLPVGIYGSAGYGYLTTRDGTQLSVQVQLPIFPEDRAGQTYPTVIEYSGYDPSNSAADDLVGGRVNEFRLIAALLGYAYVGVNIRGTGCSGGAFDYFEPLQSFDGYDIVEVVAAQPWVQYGRPGMVGISYSGISQLFVAQTRPPHLAAITPLSAIDDTFRGTLYPGGIFNDGFARSWAIERQQQNRWPNPVGADWVVNQVNEGDATCAYDQLLRQQNPDLLAKIERNPFYPEVGNPEYPNGGDVLAPFAFVRQINVPTFMVGAWQDDQTGGHWSVMVDQFDPATELRVVANNGTHADSLGPVNLLRLLEFLDFRVAQRLPIVPLEVRGLAPLLYSLVFAADGVQLPPDRFAGYTLEEALALYDGEDRIHISWESGAKPGAQTLGSPEPAAESDYARWPPAETVAQRLYLQPEGGLTADPPSIPDDDPRAVDAYDYDLSVKPRTDFRCSGGGDPNSCRSELWRAGVVYDWRPLPVGYTQSFISEPLPNQLTLLGSASADLWIASTDPDTDIEITLTEVRSDGQERYVQNGWLRASHRRLDEKHSTELRPRQTHLEVDAELLPKKDFAFVRVEIFPFAHVFRPGSQLRLSVEAPGGNRPLWTFDALTGKDTTNWLAHSVHRPSSLVLPVVPDVKVPAELPPCPTSLRAQPCRPYR